MQTKDRNNLIIVAVLITLVLIIALMFAGTRRIPLGVMAGICFLIEVGFLMPVIAKKYFELCEVKSITWMIPYVNVLQCFKGWVAIGSIICTIATLFCVFFLKLPAPVLKLFGEFAVNEGDRMFYYGIASYLVMSILWGIGYFGVIHEVKKYLREVGALAAGDAVNALENLLYLTLFVPFARVIGLTQVHTLINRALNVTVDDEEGDFEEVDYE